MQPETTNRKLMWWGVNVIVLLYAFVPVLWIVSLSLKDDATLNDGKYIPTSPSDDSGSRVAENSIGASGDLEDPVEIVLR